MVADDVVGEVDGRLTNISHSWCTLVSQALKKSTRMQTLTRRTKTEALIFTPSRVPITVKRQSVHLPFSQERHDSASATLAKDAKDLAPRLITWPFTKS